MSNRLYNTKEVAKILNISIHTLYARTSSKSIPHIKIGNKCLFKQEHIDSFINQNTVEVM